MHSLATEINYVKVHHCNQSERERECVCVCVLDYGKGSRVFVSRALLLNSHYRSVS